MARHLPNNTQRLLIAFGTGVQIATDLHRALVGTRPSSFVFRVVNLVIPGTKPAESRTRNGRSSRCTPTKRSEIVTRARQCRRCLKDVFTGICPGAPDAPSFPRTYGMSRLHRS